MEFVNLWNPLAMPLSRYHIYDEIITKQYSLYQIYIVTDTICIFGESRYFAIAFSQFSVYNVTF